MTPASVGFHCPECVRSMGQRIYTPSQLQSRAVVTPVLIGINVAVFVVGAVVAGGAAASGSSGDLIDQGALAAPFVAQGEWYRLVTAGFLHAGLLHIGLNMFLLWILGRLLEPAIGSGRFLLLYATSLLAGSLGVVIIDPGRTVGASGAVFGLMGAAVVAQRYAGIDPWRSGIGPTIGVNLLLTFLVPGISIGGHVGGLLGGAFAAFLLLGLSRRTGSRAVGIVACSAFAVVCVVAAVAISRAAYPQLVGLTSVVPLGLG